MSGSRSRLRSLWNVLEDDDDEDTGGFSDEAACGTVAERSRGLPLLTHTNTTTHSSLSQQ